MRETIFSAVFLLAFATFCPAAADTKSGRAISVFNVVKFPNEQCNGTNSKYGTCYTEDECEDRGGKSSGSCADGYGVCCTFTMGCGDSKAENCTYFESSGVTSGACIAKVCKNNKNICQIRLDFDTFEISGPSTSEDVIAKLTFGVNAATGLDATSMGRCETDTFVVAVPGGQSTSVICGKNSGQHMYIDATNACAQLSFQLASGNGATRQWAIRISQYSCDYNNLAPKGCLQYFFGTTATGTVQTFNYDDGLHLANQDQKICVRRERNMCSICWSHDTLEFDISSMEADDMGWNAQGSCCGFGSDGLKTLGYDCVLIPQPWGRTTVSMATPTPALPGAYTLTPGGSEFCGRALAAEATAVGGPVTICSYVTPFSIRFLSDNYELATEAAKNPDGFKLTYNQEECL